MYLLHLPWVEIYWDLLSEYPLLPLISLRQNSWVSVFFIFLLEYFIAAILFFSSLSPGLYGFKLLQSLFSGYSNDNLLHQLRHAMSLSLVPFFIQMPLHTYFHSDAIYSKLKIFVTMICSLMQHLPQKNT